MCLRVGLEAWVPCCPVGFSYSTIWGGSVFVGASRQYRLGANCLGPVQLGCASRLGFDVLVPASVWYGFGVLCGCWHSAVTPNVCRLYALRGRLPGSQLGRPVPLACLRLSHWPAPHPRPHTPLRVSTARSRGARSPGGKAFDCAPPGAACSARLTSHFHRCPPPYRPPSVVTIAATLLTRQWPKNLPPRAEITPG